MYASDALELSLRRALGASAIVKLLGTELSLPYYVLMGWHTSFTTAHPAHSAFFYHRKSGYSAVVAMFTRLVIIETVVFHLLVQHWSPVAAWILTGLSVYSLFWLIGDYQASRLHPIVLGPEHLYVRTGLRWQVDVPLTQIVGIRKATRMPAKGSSYLNAVVYGEPQRIVELKEPIMVHGVFGMQRKATNIGLTLDDAPRFHAELRHRMQV